MGGEWQRVGNYKLPLLLVLVFFLGFIISSYSRKTVRSKLQAPTSLGHKVPTINGNELYYERARWPVYDARFNFRLSFLHGPVVCVELGSQSIVMGLMKWLSTFLCGTRPCSDTTILINSLADDNGTLKGLLNSCPSRTPSVAAGKYLSRGRRIVLMPFGPEWTRHRKAFASLLTRDKVKNQWAGVLRFEAMVLAERLSNIGNPPPGGSSQTKWVDEISRFTASTVLQIAYARRAVTPDDPILKDLETVSKNIASAFQPGRYWVESFPLLDLFPTFVSSWKQKLNADHEFENALFNNLLQDVEQRLGSRCEMRERANQLQKACVPVEECASALLLRSHDCPGLDRDAVAYLSAGLFEAGTDTTAMTINTFLLGAASSPGFTRRAQAEMDDLMSSIDRDQRTVPGFQDLEGLQLLSACVKEALRLTPAGASGVGHTAAVAEPQSYELRDTKGEEGLKRLDVPSGAVVLANIYGLHHNSETFDDPWRFNPSRWLPPPASQEIHRRTLDHTHACFAFGFGKRICPGSTLACYSLTVAIALLLLCFDIRLTDDARSICAEIQGQNDDEDSAWKRLFGATGGELIKREKSLRTVHTSQEERIGSVLIDAHIAFKLSRAQVAACVSLVSREGGIGLEAVRDSLATWEIHGEKTCAQSG